jgi:transcriptional regulator with XRE-family HTH domain
MAVTPDRRPPIGTEIAARRRAAGWSQRELAARLCAIAGRPTVTRAEVARWERGRRQPGRYWWGSLSQLLGVAAAPAISSAAAAQRFPASARPADDLAAESPAQWLTRAGQVAQDWLLAPARRDRPVIEPGWTERVEGTERAVELLGADARAMADRLWSLVRGQPVGPALLLAAGGARMRAHAAADRSAVAFAAGVIALDAAVLAGPGGRSDRLAGARLLADLGLIALDLHDPLAAVRLTGTARLGAGRSCPATTARLALQHGLALAAAGKLDRARSALRRAGTAAAGRLGDGPIHLPDWEFAGLAGRCRAALGQPWAARRLLSRAVAADPAPARATAQLRYAADLVRVQLQLGDRATASATASAALAEAVRYGSARAVRDLLALDTASGHVVAWARRPVRWVAVRPPGSPGTSSVSVAG